MNVLIYSLTSVLVISLLSFVGVFFLAVRKEIIQKILLFLVSFATGGLLGGAFIHLIPEGVEQLGLNFKLSLTILGGVLGFFILEKFIYWRHCHIPTAKNHPHPLVFMNLVGDGFHNLLDGVMIAASFMISFPLGIVTTLAVALHEIPQEIGDFGVLIYGGFSKTKALLFNFASALTAVVGVVLTFILGSRFVELVALVVPFTAGGFIYIAGSDLIPELHKETNLGKSAVQLTGFLLGIGVMAGLTLLE